MFRFKLFYGLIIQCIISAACELIITIVLFVSGIGLLKQKKWGRTAGLTWAGYSFLATIVALVVTWTHIYPYSLKSISLDDPNAKARMLGELIFSNVFSLGFLIYPGLFALFSSKQPFKDALD